MPYALTSGTVLRAESLSALWFQPRTAETLDLDMQGVLALFDMVNGRRRFGLKYYLFRNYLLARGFVRRASSPDEKSIHRVSECLQQARSIKAPLRSRVAPEVLHLSLTDACQQTCSGCFFSNQTASPNRYMARHVFDAVISKAAEAKVFQIALGGGEPLMHPQILDFVKLADRLGIVPNLTSNGGLLDEKRALELKQAGLGQIQFSLNGSQDLIHSQTRPHFEAVFKAIEVSQKVGLRWGLNVLVTQHNMHDLEQILELAQELGAYSVNILRPKPTSQDDQWLKVSLPDAHENHRLQKILKRWQSKARFILQTDSSLAFLRQGSVQSLKKAGVSGCSAGRSMLSVQVDGRISPCSFIPLYDMMDSGDFITVWRQSEHLQRFRDLEEHLTGICHSCELKSVCRGCRAIVWHQSGSFEGGDIQCPKYRSMSS